MRKTLLAAVLSALFTGTTQAEDLVDMYQAALGNDASLRVAEATRDATKLNEPRAQSLLRPSVNLSGGAELNRNGEPGGDYHRGSAVISLDQAIYRKDLQLGLEQAKEQAVQADSIFAAEQQGLLLRVASAYFGILSAKDNLSFERAQQAAIERQLEQARQRFEVGLIAITAVHEAQAAFDQARADLILAENDLAKAREELREIISQEVGELESLNNVPLNPPDPNDMTAWAEMALENSPILETARKSVEIAKRDVELQRSTRQPSVDLSASFSHNRYGGDLDGDTNNAQLGVQVVMPLWLGGRIAVATEQASRYFDQAQEDLERQRRAIDRQVRDAFRGVKAAISAVRALEAGIVSADSALEATKAGFEVGTRTIVDVLNAERDLYNVRSNHATARYRYILAGLELKQAAGVLSEEDLQQVNSWLR